MSQDKAKDRTTRNLLSCSIGISPSFGVAGGVVVAGGTSTHHLSRRDVVMCSILLSSCVGEFWSSILVEFCLSSFSCRFFWSAWLRREAWFQFCLLCITLLVSASFALRRRVSLVLARAADSARHPRDHACSPTPPSCREGRWNTTIQKNTMRNNTCGTRLVYSY